MKHLIVGTAGHVDHGKTTLIRALTGINTDRLKEEQQRGLTIDIGFAYFDLPSGRRAGIIDVPGHERFIKNMLAGVVGIDIVLLVIAADEGIMPQTQEHLDILSLLEIEKGIVVITKIDMVEEDWLEMVQEDVRENLKGTFLEKSPVIAVSARNHTGLDRLTQTIDRVTTEIQGRDTSRPFRLPIDRAFSVRGFGTVVTGTLFEGELNVGESGIIEPSGKATKIRNIQVHSKNTKVAHAGQRVAVNLVNVSVEDCKRGEVFAAEKLLQPSMMLDVSLKVLQNSIRGLRHWDRVRVYSGTSEVLARVVLLDREELAPGEKSLVQLRLEQPVACLRGDRLVIRYYSPLTTVGGGRVIDANPCKKKRFRNEILEELQLRENGSPVDIMSKVLERESSKFLNRHELSKISGLLEEETERALEKLLQSEEALSVILDDTEYILWRQHLSDLFASIEKFVSDYHRKYPLRIGVPKEELRMRFVDYVSTKLFSQLLLLMRCEYDIEVEKEYVKLSQHEIALEGKWGILAQKAIAILERSAYSPPGLDELSTEIGISMSQIEELLNALMLQKEAVKIGENFWIVQTKYDKAKEQLKQYLLENGAIGLGEFRDLFSTSRKYALPLLEHFDAIKLTQRQGDKRVLHRYSKSTP